jgi:hypothetical protein
VAQTGRTVKLGDLVVSSHASSPGIYGRVTAISSQTSVTVTYQGSLRGAAGPQGPATVTAGAGLTMSGGTISLNLPTSFSANSPPVGGYILAVNAVPTGTTTSVYYSSTNHGYTYNIGPSTGFTLISGSYISCGYFFNFISSNNIIYISILRRNS